MQRANGIEDFTYVLILCVSIGLENTLATRSTVTIPSQRIGTHRLFQGVGTRADCDSRCYTCGVVGRIRIEVGELTTAVFVTDAGIGGFKTRTVKFTVAEAPLAMFPKLQVTVPTCAGGGAEQDAPPEFIGGIDRRTAGWQRHSRRAYRAPRVQRKRRQFGISADRDARASVS